ncbi:hypothetical protein QUB16_28670 [Microcoleus sp. D3_18a_C4]
MHNTHILHYSQERALRPIPQRVDFLVEQAGKPVPKRLIENGARCQSFVGWVRRGSRFIYC